MDEMNVHCKSIDGLVTMAWVIGYVWFGIFGSIWILLKHHIYTPKLVKTVVKDTLEGLWIFVCAVVGWVCCCCGKRQDKQ